MKYLVQIQQEDGGISSRLMTENEIIRAVSMIDCTGEELMVFDISTFGEAKKLEVLGCWHDTKDPLKICVMRGEEMVFCGYGEDH